MTYVLSGLPRELFAPLLSSISQLAFGEQRSIVSPVLGSLGKGGAAMPKLLVESRVAYTIARLAAFGCCGAEIGHHQDMGGAA